MELPYANRDKQRRRAELIQLFHSTNNSTLDVEKSVHGAAVPTRKANYNGLLRRIGQNSGYIFLFCVFVALTRMQAAFFAEHRHDHRRLSSHPDVFRHDESMGLRQTSKIIPFSNEKDPEAKSSITEHPIPKLMEQAEYQYRQKLSRQSKTLTSAVQEYRRRYKRDPPKGFDKWWAFAKKHNAIMVDEYDGLVEDLAPFWEISGEELRRRAGQIGELPSINVVRLRDGEASIANIHQDFDDSEVSARARGFRSMLGKFVHTLPDMDFPINTKAEGRVIVPWEHRKYPNLTVQDSSADANSVVGSTFRPDWAGNGNVWEAWRRTCAPTAPARRLFSSMRDAFSNQATSYLSPEVSGPGSDFLFVPTTSAKTLDFCATPHEHYTQGHFFSDWRTIPALYPVFSPARTKGFLDIKIPSHYYYGSTKGYTYGWDPVKLKLTEVDKMEVPWEEKSDKIFWRGATTGGGSHPPGFSPQYQRHRFLRMTSNKSSVNRTVTFVDPPSTTHYVSVPVPAASLNEEIMDTAFVKATSPGSYPGGLTALMDAHRFGDSVPLGKHWSYKYLIDLDGMGYSGRFMSFLASDSVPLKATVYEEFFSDWIQPWVHFIPVSSTYQEIYNIHAYFSGATTAALQAANSTQLQLPTEYRGSLEGDQRLRQIARAGKQWKKTIGRTIDMEGALHFLVHNKDDS